MSTFLQVVELLLTSDGAKAAYADDSATFLEGHGLGALDDTDVRDALQYASDSLPAPVAVRLDPASGLDSVAAIDLESEGLTLERQPIEIDDPGDLFGSDVEFDMQSADDRTGLADEDVVDGWDGEDNESPDNSESPSIADDDRVGDIEMDVVEFTTVDDALTDTPIDDVLVDSVAETVAAEDLHDVNIADITDDVPDDLPDDFDLLD